MPDRYATDYAIGQHNSRTRGMHMRAPMSLNPVLPGLLLVVGSVLSSGLVSQAFDGSRGWSTETFDWLSPVAGQIFVLLSIALVLLPVGRVRPGGVDARPEPRASFRARGNFRQPRRCDSVVA